MFGRPNQLRHSWPQIEGFFLILVSGVQLYIRALEMSDSSVINIATNKSFGAPVRKYKAQLLVIVFVIVVNNDNKLLMQRDSARSQNSVVLYKPDYWGGRAQDVTFHSSERVTLILLYYGGRGHGFISAFHVPNHERNPPRSKQVQISIPCQAHIVAWISSREGVRCTKKDSRTRVLIIYT
jgi:hypothetical protein